MLYGEEVYYILGACFEVYKRMGCGFLEAVYQECLEIEFEQREIPFEAQKELSLTYRGNALQQKYVPDFVCYDKIFLEIKACSNLTDEHYAQLLNYLHGSGIRVGLLANFGHYPKLGYKRMVV